MAKKTASAKTPCECNRYSVLSWNDKTEDWDTKATTGCPGTLTGRTFAPGHDAKLKGFLIRAGLEHEEVSDDQGVTANPIQMADRYGFGHMVRAGIENGKFARAEAMDKKRKRAEAAERRNDKANAKAETTHDGNSARKERELTALVAAEEAKFAAEQAAQAEARPEPEWDEDDAPRIATAKVGRWTYEGTVEGDTFTYVKANGEAASTTKFELV